MGTRDDEKSISSGFIAAIQKATSSTKLIKLSRSQNLKQQEQQQKSTTATTSATATTTTTTIKLPSLQNQISKHMLSTTKKPITAITKSPTTTTLQNQSSPLITPSSASVSSARQTKVVSGDSITVERRCENASCTTPTLISLVPTKETAEYVRDPYVVTNPVLVNGFTTIFQVDGSTVPLNRNVDIGAGGKSQIEKNKPIYKIVPNTHSHIVNYVIVDNENDIMKKLKDNDAVTTKKLLETQINSANKLLSKLMGLKNDEGNIIAPSNVKISYSPAGKSVQKSSNAASQGKIKTSFLPQKNVPNPLSTPQLKIPVSKPENLIIQPAKHSVPLPVKIITSKVQNVQPVQIQIPSGLTVTAVTQAPTPPVETPESSGVSLNAFERLQAELKELRDTVKQLSQSQGQQPPTTTKRPESSMSSTMKKKKRMI